MNSACRTTDPDPADGLPDGFTLHHFETVGSTNDELAKLVAAGAPSGTVVFADRQTRGRGRLGRTWRSEPGNLYASTLLRPDCDLREASQLSLLTGVALADALSRHAPAGRQPRLKWPNDLLIMDAKIAGILLESVSDRAGRLDHVIIGTGLNVAWAPEGMTYPVTCLNAAGYPERPPRAWLVDFVIHLAAWLDRWQTDGFAGVRKAWRDRSYGLGQSIRLRLDREEVHGRFVDLTETGALLIEHADGTRRELTAGELVRGDR